MTQIVLSGFSRTEIEQKIDDFLAEDKPFKVVDLILPAVNRATRFSYRGLRVRKWYMTEETVLGQRRLTRYDTAVDVVGEKV